MNIQLSDNLISAIIGGAVGSIVGILGAVLQTYIQRFYRRKGVRNMLEHEITINVEALESYDAISPLPVRSIYLWDGLRSEVPGLLSNKQIVAMADFYYDQARVYKKKATPPERLTKEEVEELVQRGKKALQLLGTSA